MAQVSRSSTATFHSGKGSNVPGSRAGGKPQQERFNLQRSKEMAQIYATILIKHSNYAKTMQERHFFETLYDFSARVLFTSYDRKTWYEIENELGRLFRSGAFNYNERKNGQRQQKQKS